MRVRSGSGSKLRHLSDSNIRFHGALARLGNRPLTLPVMVSRKRLAASCDQASSARVAEW